jgi:hypothetical protein
VELSVSCGGLPTTTVNVLLNEEPSVGSLMVIFSSSTSGNSGPSPIRVQPAPKTCPHQRAYPGKPLNPATLSAD